jgi:hypothetical protein
MRRLLVFLLFSSAAAGAAPSAADGARGSLTGLAGSWQAKTAKGSTITLTFRATARGTAIVETYTAGTTETLTIFHRDGDSLLATHYCAQGNQPRLSLTEPGTPRLLVFEFRDATNLARQRLASLAVDARPARFTGVGDDRDLPRAGRTGSDHAQLQPQVELGVRQAWEERQRHA